MRILALGPTGMSISRWVEPAATFFDRMEATSCSRVSMASGRSTEIRMSSAGDSRTWPPQTRQPLASRTSACMRSIGTSTFASTSMVSAVPAGEVMARDEVLGIGRPWAATIGTTIIEVRLPGMPPMQCLSAMVPKSRHCSRVPAAIMARVSPSTSAVVMKLAQAIRKAAISIFE